MLKEHGYSLFEQNQMTAEDRQSTIKWLEEQAQKRDKNTSYGHDSVNRQELPATIKDRLGQK